MPNYNSNLSALNDILGDYGLPGGHRFEIDALNALAVHLGGTGGHQFNIGALNEIVGLVEGSGTFQFEIDAYNEISRALGGPSNFQFVEDALSEISDLPVFEGGGGEPEWLPEAPTSGDPAVGYWSFEDDNYYSDGGEIEAAGLTALFVADGGTGATFSLADISASGLDGDSEPAFSGFLLSGIVAGATIVFDVTLDAEDPLPTFSFYVASADQNQYIEVSIRQAEASRIDNYDGAENIVDNLIQAGRNRIAINVSAVEIAVSANGDAVASRLVSEFVTWASMGYAHCGSASDPWDHLHAVELYPLQPKADLPALSGA